MSEAKRDVQDVNDRVDNIIQGGSPDKDAEVVDMRHPDPEYHPKRPIQVAGDMMRDMQDQFTTQVRDIERQIRYRGKQSSYYSTVFQKLRLSQSIKITCMGDSLTY